MNQPRAIGVIAPQLSGVYFAEVLRGIQNVFKHQYPHLICFQGNPREIATSRLASSLVAGWIVINAAEGIELLCQSGPPCVAIGIQASEAHCPVVSPDNRGGMQTAVAHLLTLGHRTIAFVGDITHSDMKQRYAGYLAAYAAQGIPTPTGMQVTDPVSTIAARELIQHLRHDLQCTAVVGATDEIALMLISSILELELNIPVDMAVVGFDDIILAQAATPPLTTVRYSIEAVGRTAAELLLAELNGETVARQPHYVPTSLILRQSCGGRSNQEPSLTHAQMQFDAHWQAALHQELLKQLYSPAPPPPDPQHAWPESRLLIQGLVACVDGGPAITTTDIVQIWRSAVLICGDSATLLSTIDVLERWGQQYFQHYPADQEAQQRVTTFLQLNRAELVHSLVSSHIQLLIAVLTFPNQSVDLSMTLLGARDSSARQLDWLRFTSFFWGCLALWDRNEQQLNIVGQYRPIETSPATLQYRPETFPGAQLLSGLLDEGNLLLLLPIRTQSQNWGILALTATLGYLYSSASYDALKPIQTLLGTALDHEVLESNLQQAAERTQFLTTTIQELSCPVIPLLPGIVLIPLIGTIDMTRAQLITEATLAGVTTYHASTIILDITAVPIVDTQIAQALVQTTRAATLLGAKVILVGIRPEIAQSLVGLGADLRGIQTYATLATVLAAQLNIHP